MTGRKKVITILQSYGTLAILRTGKVQQEVSVWRARIFNFLGSESAVETFILLLRNYGRRRHCFSKFEPLIPRLQWPN
jgi:hypothetical protein